MLPDTIFKQVVCFKKIQAFFLKVQKCDHTIGTYIAKKTKRGTAARRSNVRLRSLFVVLLTEANCVRCEEGLACFECVVEGSFFESAFKVCGITSSKPRFNAKEWCILAWWRPKSYDRHIESYANEAIACRIFNTYSCVCGPSMM